MIEVRRKRHENELHEKYMQLYHNEQCYEELMQSWKRLIRTDLLNLDG